MDNDKLNTVAPEQDDDIMLPEGYEDEKIFDEPTGDDENIFGKEDAIDGFGGEDESVGDSAPEGQTAQTESEKEDGVGKAGGEDEVPAAAYEEAGSLIKFKDGDQEITLNERELSELYRFRKEHAGNIGHLQELQAEMETLNTRAKALGFENADKMFSKAVETYRESEVKRLVKDGVNEEVARYMVESQTQQRVPHQEQKTTETPRRNFRQELSELLADRPHLREELVKGGKLPQEVVAAAVKTGAPLRTVYAEYEVGEVKKEAERLKQENNILRQNAEAKSKAPVKGVSAGGHVETKGKDPFLEGLLSDD